MLEWHVEKEANGRFKRRRAEGDTLGLEYIDVVWKCSLPFPEDTVRVPVTHPPKIEYQIVPAGRREEIHDQVIVTPAVSDSTVARMLDEKAPALAASLGLSKALGLT